MAKNVYQDSPFGEAIHPHLNKPDSKFNPDNPLFKTGLRVGGEDAQKLKAKIDAAAQAAFDEFFATGEGRNLSEKERAKFSVYVPYEETEEDGVYDFDFKQNARIKLRDGTVKDIAIGKYDANGDDMDKLIRHGSEIRINYSMRPIPMKSLKQVGVRLDFGRVQVRKLVEGGGGGFGKVDGYVDDGASSPSREEPPVDGNADY